MGGLGVNSGANFFLSMLNGTDTPSFGKEIENSQFQSKDFAEVKMGIPDPRFYCQDPGQDSCGLQLPYPTQSVAAGYGGQTGRFFAPTPLNTCNFGAVRTPPGGGGGGQGFPGTGSEVFGTPPEIFPMAGDGRSFQHGYPRAPMCQIPGLQVSGKTHAILNNYQLWAKFHKYQTEMIITKQGRRMFPFLSFNISGLDPSAHYNVYVDVVLADQHHWRYQGGKWVQCGKAEGNMPGNRTYMHPDSPNTGAHWMRQEISFGKLKLTNNKGANNNVAQMIVLQSLHKYQPRLHIVEVKEDGSDEGYLSPKAQNFIFPETQFIAVTAYQNADITQLKIDHNPFAKGFRDNFDTMYAPAENDRMTPSPTNASGCQQLISGGRYPQPYLPEQYINTHAQSRYYNRDQTGAAHLNQSKEPGSNAHSHWYFSPTQPPAPRSRMDFSTFESEFSGNAFVSYKPFPIQTSAHHPLQYYPDHPFGSVAPGGWGSSRGGPQYHHHAKGRSGLGWKWSVTADPRLHPQIPEQNLHILPQDKSKEGISGGDDPWLEPPSVKSVDSVDSGLFEGGESKKRRVSPYASSTESSPPNRSGDNCEKDSGSDAGYYGFYGN
ncbi:T-box transcription factor TBX21 [Erpetoichthys calabaricus]|uniref:T-box transcription factor 21 n=1 Tax=Erpetoichthys calabaricus TaxID=27687 RepID=A0A8C4XHD9_ERPCA|nr:T-box transcription factor TBX21 [Erpetoichthys calabaricus]